MNQRIAHISLVVDNYDDAIDFYVNKLHFDLIEDTRLSETKRWVLIAPKGAKECCLLLAEASKPSQKEAVGNQTGGRVFLFLHTDDFDRDYKNLLNHNITIVREPIEEPYGKVCVFSDLYGNLWDMIQPNQKNTWYAHLNPS